MAWREFKKSWEASKKQSQWKRTKKVHKRFPKRKIKDVLVIYRFLHHLNVRQYEFLRQTKKFPMDPYRSTILIDDSWKHTEIYRSESWYISLYSSVRITFSEQTLAKRDAMHCKSGNFSSVCWKIWYSETFYVTGRRRGEGEGRRGKKNGCHKSLFMHVRGYFLWTISSNCSRESQKALKSTMGWERFTCTYEMMSSVKNYIIYPFKICDW